MTDRIGFLVSSYMEALVLDFEANPSMSSRSAEAEQHLLGGQELGS